MNGCLNIIWHFPFLGFLSALLYAIFGVLLCCTIILYPVGLGFFQIAKFLLSPFSSALVSHNDLDLIQSSEHSHSTVAHTYSTLISVFYIPFGIVAAAGAIFIMLGEFLSIIGIPCGIVWFKVLPAIFMPVNKVCVPKAVAEEIERVKAGKTVEQFKAEKKSEGESDQPEDLESDSFESDTPVSVDVPEVRKFDTAKLQDIIANSAMYRASLVDNSRRELEIRERSKSFSEQVSKMDDDRLREVLTHPQLYAEELIYACEQEQAERRRIWREQQQLQEEQARIERERKSEEARLARIQREKEMAERRAAIWKKWRPYVFVIIVLALIAIVVAYMQSSSYHYKRGVELADKGLTERAIRRLSTITDPDFKHYSTAYFLLYQQYLKLNDSLSAARALAYAVSSTKKWEDDRPYITYAQYCLDGQFEPYILLNKRSAAQLYNTSPDPIHKIKAGKLFFENGYYNSAFDVFDKLSYDPIAKGYLGMIYLFGLGGQKRNLETAWDYLLTAPNELPFVVYKGDLALLLRKGSNNVYTSIYKSIEMANPYYAIAAQMDTTNSANAIRYEVTQKIIAAKKKHDKINYWDRGKIYWSSYTTTSDVSYFGEVSYIGGESANGWGCFTWRDSKIVRLGYFSNSKCNGYGINITEDYVDVGKLSGYYGRLVEGCRIWSDGDLWTGTWKAGKLVKGEKYDINGRLIQTVK